MILLELDRATAGHIATAMAFYRAQQDGRGVKMPAGFDQLLAAATKAARAVEDPLDGVPAVLTTEEAAAVARVDPRTIQRHIAAGHLRAVRNGGTVRIRRDALADYLADR